MARWFPVPPRPSCPDALRVWLTVPDSLTRRLQRTGGDFRVRCVREGAGASLLRLQARERIWEREVVLELDGQAVIFAHTELLTASGGPLRRWLARLGHRSLGTLLFTRPGFRRSPIEYACLDRRDALYRRAARALPLPTRLWARRSTHRLGRQAVVVVELFLPALARHPAVRIGQGAVVLR